MQPLEKTPTAQNLSQLIKNIPVNSEPPQYNHIELDEAELDEALRLGRERKHFRLMREEYNRRLLQQQTYGRVTAEELFKQYADNFTLADKAHETKIKNLCCYFAADARFRGELRKGLFITGNVGNGKSTLMKCFTANQNHGYKVVSMLDVSFDYKMNGEEGVRGYGANFKTAPNWFGLTEVGYCFDDVGTEEVPARHYGETKNIFSEIIQVRYHNSHLVPFNSTHVTTNKDTQEFLDLYGARTYDRMKEMFNVIAFEHGSFRG